MFLSQMELPYFNSQPHKEADKSNSFIRADETDFNSQPHKEADNEKQINNATIIISTHSLTRRLTFSSSYVSNNSSYFNSQPHKEADDIFHSAALFCCIFQLTASQGG